MSLWTKAATVTTAAALLLVPSFASAQEPTELDGSRTGPGNPNYEISGENGYDNTLPSLEGDTYIDPGVPLEGDVWYYGHGGKYGPGFVGDPDPENDSSGARAAGEEACGEFDENFGDNERRNDECASAAVSVMKADMAPRLACWVAELSKRVAEGNELSNQGACIAAAKAANA